MYKNIEFVHNKKAPLSKVVNVADIPQSDGYYFDLLKDYGISLNAGQQQAVSAVDGPVLIVAGPGSGKTTVLTTRVGYMLQEKNIDPTKILLVTYTKEASSEMIGRLGRIPGVNTRSANQVHAGTYHAICLRMLRAEGFDFRILSNNRQQHILLKRILKEFELEESYSPEVVLNVISSWKNSLQTPGSIMPIDDVTEELIAIYRAYEEYKEENSLFDFDDILLEAFYLLQHSPEVLKKYQEQFEYILCDEFQDTSEVQYKIIQMLAEPHNNLCIVGDDDQCVYGFRAANSSFMINFPVLYPNCRQIILDINYRSTPNIVGFGNQVIGHNQHRIEKVLKSVSAETIDVCYNCPKTSDDEAQTLVEDIKRRVAEGEKLQDFAVIYRTHATGRAIFDKLLDADIPFVTFANKTVSFYENTFVRPILAVLKGATGVATAEDLIEAAPVFYIAKKDMKAVVERIENSANGIQKDSLERCLLQIADGRTGFMKESLIRKAKTLPEILKVKPAAAIHMIRKGDIDYERQLAVDARKTLSIHKEMVIENLDEVEQASRSHDTVQDFLSFVERVKEKNQAMEGLRKDPSLNAVKLMTIHTSKGLEFETVYAIGWTEGILPHSSAINTKNKAEDTNLNKEEMLEEERRLAYVVVTRAKRHLLISSPQKHRGYNADPSRFLLEALSQVELEEKRETTEVALIN